MAARTKKPIPPVSEPSLHPEAIGGHLGRRVKKLRGQRHWSLEQLSAGSGVSRSMLSEIEREKANPTLAVTFRIATAFGLSLSELIESADPSPTLLVTRGNDPSQIFRADRLSRVKTLSPLNLEKDVEIYEVTLQPKGALRSAAHFEGTREFLTVVSGSVRVESAGESAVLGAGDSATYKADVDHAIVNVGQGTASVFLVDIYRPGA